MIKTLENRFPPLMTSVSGGDCTDHEIMGTHSVAQDTLKVALEKGAHSDQHITPEGFQEVVARL